MRNINKEIIYNDLINNECYFLYDVIDRKIKYAIYKDEVIYNNASIEMIYNDDYFSIDKKSQKDIMDFIERVEMENSKDQISFKATKNGISKWYLLEAFSKEDDRYIKGTVKSIYNIMKDKDTLIELSQRDSLTGLYNRLAVNKEIKKLITNNSFFNMLLIDVDFFKDINDSFGHSVGDETLKAIAEKLMLVVGDNGIVSRFGGDEFLLLYKFDHAPTNDESRRLCSTIRSEIRRIDIRKKVNAELTVTIASVTYPFDGQSFGTLFDNVDKALYRGKKKGRDCYVIYIPSLHSNIDVSKPLPKISNSDNEVSLSTFISNLLSTLLESKSIPKINEKVIDIALFSHVERAMIISQKNGLFKINYIWCKSESDNINKYFDILDIKEYASLFSDDDTFVINNVGDEIGINKRLKKALKLPYDTGSIVQVACGKKNKIDLILSFELLTNRRIWTREELMCLKISSKIIAEFYKE